MHILESLVLHGSLLKSELLSLLQADSSASATGPAKIEKVLEELIQANYVTGAHSY
jgi:hypothetical protein